MSISENREQQSEGYAHARCSCESGGGGSYALPPQKSGALLSLYIVSTVSLLVKATRHVAAAEAPALVVLGWHPGREDVVVVPEALPDTPRHCPT